MSCACWRNKKKILLKLMTSKTHGRGHAPQEIKIEARHNNEEFHRHRFYCPFILTSRYMQVCGTYTAETEPFFLFQGKLTIPQSQLRNTLKLLLQRLNLDTSLYGMHSFRGGRTSDMLKMHYSINSMNWFANYNNIFTANTPGYDKVWFLGDKFMSKSFGQYFQDINRNGENLSYIRQHYDTTGSCSGSFFLYL